MRYLPSAAASLLVVCCCLFDPHAQDSPPTGVATASDRPSDEALPKPLASLRTSDEAETSVQPCITLTVKPEKPRAGMRCWIVAETSGLSERKKLKWTWPADEIDGIKFDSTDVLAYGPNRRMVEVVWPKGGKYTVEARAAVVTVIERDEQGNPIDWDAEDVRASVVLELAGGVGPDVDPSRPQLPTPSAELQAAVAPITAKLSEARALAEAIQLADIYRDLADVIARDATVITRVGHVATITERAGTLLVQPNKFGPTGLAATINALSLGVTGKQDVALTPETRAKLVELFRAIAWAAQQVK